MPKDKSSKNEKTVEQTYTKMSQHEHVLAESDNYIGSKDVFDETLNVFDDKLNRIVKKRIEYIPGLYKIYDEIIVNSRDQHIRDSTCNEIHVNIDAKTNTISVYNNGNGIPVKIHKEYDMYIPELIFGHLLTSSNYKQKGKTVGGKNGLGGKCLTPNTFLPTFIGEIKQAKDITLDDQLIGDDGKSRKIKKIIKGTGQLYKITQSDGESYTVNDQHILTLHMPDHKVVFWNTSEQGWSVLWWNNDEYKINKKTFKTIKSKIKCEECDSELSSNLARHYSRKHKDIEVPKQQRKSPTIEAPDTDEVKQAKKEMKKFCKTIPDDNTFDIEIGDYMNLNETTKGRLAGIRGECVDWKKQEVELDPYILGLWLGDGNSDGCGYTCNTTDTEIVEYLTKWATNNNMEFIKNDTFHYNFKSLNSKIKQNPFKELLKKYNLVKNKHVPKEYIVNDKETRLKVLAGIIDTDGTVQRNGTRIVISQGMMHKSIIDDITLIARSLGFYCSRTIKKTSWTHNGEKKNGEAYNLNISGDIGIIPTLLPRKKCVTNRVHSIRTTGRITVTDAGIGDYIGFELNRNQRFVLEDFTVTHNCANIFSTKFIVETLDVKERKEYRQVFENNMFKVNKPKITDVDKKAEPYTRITFTPDLEKFGVEDIPDGMLELFKKRVYDLAACTSENMKVYYNDEKIKVKTFKDYIYLHYDEKLPSDLVYEEVNDRWRVGVLYDTLSGHQQVSFVNGINTYHGGTHVKYVTDQIVDKLTAHIKKKNKALNVKPQYIRENLTVFVDAIIEDPSFESQTKENLKLAVSKFGSKCELSKKFIDAIIKTGICEEVMKTAENKDNIALNKVGGTKTERVRNIPKLDDAEEAGKRNANKCRLILTEGDSAKKFAIDGISYVGNKYYGAFPLRGKLLNVRDANPKTIMKNEEICNIMKIMGLKIKTDKLGNVQKSNISINKLRYGGIIILTDADNDGSHIKGLLINFIHYFWPSLLQYDGFIQSIITPIIKVFKGSKGKSQQVKSFDTITSFKQWCDNENPKGWLVKYYKGLGTSTKEDAIEVFSELERRRIDYVWDINKIMTDIGDKEIEEIEEIEEVKQEEDHPCFEAIDLAFNKKKADMRKDWLQNHDDLNIIDYDNINRVTFKDFIDKDLRHFSNSDVIRSVPAIDGFKPSQRKVLYGCFSNNKLKKGELKVSQLAGYIAEHTEYHHGENNLFGTIIKMAQDFRGANNINLLKPNGNFGSYNAKGKDAGAPRYIFTEINPITYKLFRNEDNKILDYVFEDNKRVEPKLYAPIIPIIIINGTLGIGTGYSSTIPMFNPKEICENIKLLLKGEKQNKLLPWYRGFNGEIEEEGGGKYITAGIFVNDDKSVTITELPIGTCIQDYKEFLEEIIVDTKTPTTKQFITHYKSIPDNDKVNITVFFYSNNLQQFIKKGILLEKLKLQTSLRTTNMWLYNTEGKLHKYNSAEEIIESYYDYRYIMYERRKKYYTKILEHKHDLLFYKKQFIEYYFDDKIKINKKTNKAKLIEQLEKYKFPKLSKQTDADENSEDDDNDDNDESDKDDDTKTKKIQTKKSYDYLTSQTLISLTVEKIDDLTNELEKIKQELIDYKKVTIEELWTREIDEFLDCYEKYLKEMELRDYNTQKKLQSKYKTKKTLKSK